jgi:hypothetical protein
MPMMPEYFKTGKYVSVSSLCQVSQRGAEKHAAAHASITALQSELERSGKNAQSAQDQNEISSKQNQLLEHQQVILALVLHT